MRQHMSSWTHRLSLHVLPVETANVSFLTSCICVQGIEKSMCLIATQGGEPAQLGGDLAVLPWRFFDAGWTFAFMAASRFG